MFARAGYALLVVFAAGLIACGTPQPEEVGSTTHNLSLLDAADLDGMGIELHRIETLTAAGHPGRVIYAKDNTHQLSTKWVPNDWRRFADGENITYVVDPWFKIANGSVDSEPAVDASFKTFTDVTCSQLPIVKREPVPGVFPSAILSLPWLVNDPFVADIVELGYLPGWVFDMVLGEPGAQDYVLGVAFTFIFIYADGTPTDMDGNGKLDTALKEIWYNDNFPWTTDGQGGFDIETVTLHENGHALEMGHFGMLHRTPNGKIHFSPLAVMNAIYSGVRRELTGNDIASYCSLFGAWPMN
jgi:hypothetical protein